MEEKHPWVSMVVANYNGEHFLKDCLDSLFALNYPPERLEIIVVDNCSEDGSVKFLKEHYPRAIVLQNDVNNYCRANNLGAKAARGEYIAFINNDIRLHRGWLLELIKIMQQKRSVGVLGGKILFPDNRIQSAGHEEYPNFYWGDRGFKEEDHGQYESVEEVGSLCGAAVLFRRTCLEDVGGMDEDFTMYLEDVDICFRCKKKNWGVFYIPQSLSWHRFSGTSKARSVVFFSERNRLLLLAKHFPEKLAEALYGKGYFVGNADHSIPQSIFDILPIVSSKIPENQDVVKKKDVLAGIFAELGRMAKLERNILTKRLEESNESSLARWEAAEAAIKEKETHFTSQLEAMKTALIEKESQLTQLASQLEGARSVIKVIGEKEALLAHLTVRLEEARGALSEKESSLVRLQQEKMDLTSSYEETKRVIGEKESLTIRLTSQLGETQEAMSAMGKTLARAKDELEILKGDWARIASFEKKTKCLVIKSNHTSVEATEAVIRAIKRKHPHASLWLFANLSKDDHERLSKNAGVDKKVFFRPDVKRLSFFELLRSIFLFRLARFDFAVIPVSPGGSRGYQGYRKARIIAFLSGARSRYLCDVG